MFPIHVYLKSWGIAYDPAELEEDELDLVAEEIQAALYDKYPRLLIGERTNPYEKRNSAVKAAKKASKEILSHILPDEEKEDGSSESD